MTIVAYLLPIMMKGMFVNNKALSEINFISRVGLGFLFIYHGLVPKIIWLSPTEVELSSVHPFGLPVEWVPPLAGVLETLLGLSILFFRKSLISVYLAAIALALLLLFVAIVKPTLLVEAFNPVSTNLLGLTLCYITMKTHGPNQ